MSSFPHVQYSFLNSKNYKVQIAYYVAIALTFPNTTASITPAEYYSQVNEIFSGYRKYGNVVEYLVQSDQHCYTNNNHYFVADTTGSNGGGEGIRGDVYNNNNRSSSGFGGHGGYPVKSQKQIPDVTDL